ncbi:MAG: arylsulfatase [bacterium]|nr:arylsulfatase [bacterium]
MRTLALALLVAWVASAAHAAEKPPNIVFILADDLGYAELGCYGQKWIRTPHLDRLAAAGMRFTQHYAGNAVCAPSRACLMTGLHPGHARIRNNGNPPERRKGEQAPEGYFPGQNPLADADVTLAEVLRAEGYATAAIGKWGLGYEGSSGDPNRQGFDLFYGYNCQKHAHNHYPRYLWRNAKKEQLAGNDRSATGATYSQDRFVDEALDFIRENAERPFFVYLPLAVPHLSIQVPAESLAEYAERIPEEDYEHRGYIRHAKPRAGYAAMVTHMDRGVGRIVALLEELELTGDTIVVFTSDNGPAYDRLGGSDSDFFASAGGLRGSKGSLYEGGLRVPLIVRWPARVRAASTSDHPSAAWDWMATLAAAAGAGAPAGDGLSFLPELTGEEQAEHECLYWEFPGYGGQVAVRMGKWKGVRRALGKRPNAPLELYDLELDRGEERNVAGEHADVAERIRALMAREHERSSLFPFPALDGK